MRADNTRHLAKAAHRRAEQTRRRAVTALRQLADTNEPLTVSTLAQRANVSRARKPASITSVRPSQIS